MVCPEGEDASDCVPRCGPSIYGDLLLLNIGGDDTKMTCELHQTLYSWSGSAGDGGFIGRDCDRFVSSLLSHGPGVFSLTMDKSVTVATAVNMVTGQSAMMDGSGQAKQPIWAYTGPSKNAAFELESGAKLQVRQVEFFTGGLAFRVENSATLSGSLWLSPWQLSSVRSEVTCTGLRQRASDDGVNFGESGFSSSVDCTQDAAAGVVLSGPAFITSSGGTLQIADGTNFDVFCCDHSLPCCGGGSAPGQLDQAYCCDNGLDCCGSGGPDPSMPDPSVGTFDDVYCCDNGLDCCGHTPSGGQDDVYCCDNGLACCGQG